MSELFDYVNSCHTANARMIEAIAIALDDKKIIPLKELIPTMSLLWLNTRLKGDEDAAKCMKFVIDRLKSISDCGIDPVTMLSLETNMLQQTAPALRPALIEWLAIASLDEISDDVLESLQKFQQNYDKSKGV